MTSFLAAVAERKRAEVARRRRRTSSAALLRAVEPAQRSLRAALARPGRRFILECKRRSPTAGPLRAGFDPASLAAAWAGVADAVSVLTDGPAFGGSLRHLELVRAAIGVPVLRKDFVVDPYQVLEGRAHGADAVLLILALLDDQAYRDCADAAAALGLEILTEVHDEAELARALALGAGMIGINNRDLRTLTVDLGTVPRLAPLVPPGPLVVAESGYRTRAEVAAAGPRVDAFLVGSALMRTARADLAARELAFGRVKVCGLTSPGDARAAHAAGAALGGVIFADESPRRVDEAAARAIAAGPLPLVGVFVNDAPARIAGLATRLRLRAVQLHGEESPADVAALRARLPRGCEVWKAVAVQDRIPAPEETGADRVLLDGHRPGRRGGTGTAFDWSRLAGIGGRERFLLGGGLHPGNAAAAQALGCFALDACSGLESAPGVKAPARLGAFFAALRGAP